MRLPIAREGWPFILPLLGVASLGLMLGIEWGWLILAVAAFVSYFFRDPERSIPAMPGVLVAPADGKVVAVTPFKDGLDQPSGTLISIFLSVLDVHVNRAPVAGTVADVRYLRGRFLPAFKAEASASNEQNILTLQTGTTQVIVKQIAGILARRIVCRVKMGDRLGAGERFGLIRFGSRVDVLIPSEFVVSVCLGQRVRGGESVLASARLQPPEPARAIVEQDGRTLA